MADKRPSEVDLLELFGIVWKHRIFIFSFAIVGAVAMAVATHFMKPKYVSVATFLVHEEKKSSPLDSWGSLAEQFGYKIKEGSDPLLSMVDRVLKSESFYAPVLARSLNPAYPDSSLAKLFKVDTLPEDVRLEAFTGKITKTFKVKLGEDKVYTLTASTTSPHLSQFIANEVVDRLNEFFLQRQAKDHKRKLEFLLTELDKTRDEMDSASNALRIFQESNKDFSSPMLAFRYSRMKRDEAVFNEKFMITMKAYQSMNITASQPEFFFEEFQMAKQARGASFPQKPKMIAGAFAGSLIFGAILVVLFKWLLLVRRRPEAV